MIRPFARGSLLLAALASLTPAGRAAVLVIDAGGRAAPPRALGFPIGGRSPDGRVFSANSRYLTLDGRPWFPVMGEFHFARVPAGEWTSELLKMKAGGVTVVSTYVFWIFHEEREARFDWSGRRDLRRFVEDCRREGLLVWLRVGPWDHGEVRNGGFPDWLVKSGIGLRGNDPRYLALVRRFYGQIAEQVRGEFWKDGGPIAGVQIENEYHPARGGIEHMRTLRRIALQAGLDPPYFSATGWDNAAVPPTDFLTVFGGYTEQFWSGSRTLLPPNPNFFFTHIRAEDNVMGDLAPKNPAYNARYDGTPFLTAEMGAGMATAYHRRPVMHADDSAAAVVVKLGSGIAGLGYYMYQGGTNPRGGVPMEETQSAWNGYNDMEEKSYDFQAPLGEFGQRHSVYYALKPINQFLDEFGPSLAPMASRFPRQRPTDRYDFGTPRVALRTDGRGGYLFINNYERDYDLGPKRDFQVRLRFAAGPLTVPVRPTTIPSGAYPIWPINFEVAGATLRYATAQLVCGLDDPRVLVFFAWPGLPAEFEFEAPGGASIEAPGSRMDRAGSRVRVDGIVPGAAEAIRVIPKSGGPPVSIVVLSREQAMGLWTGTVAGRVRLVLSPAGVVFEPGGMSLGSRRPGDLRFGILPAVSGASGFREAGRDGLFQEFEYAGTPASPSPKVEITPIRGAGPGLPPRISPKPRAVAEEPRDADFARAAEWKLRVDVQPTDPPSRAFLRIDYAGDVARVCAGGRLRYDNFYKGAPWEIGLWRFTPEQLREGLDLKILPLRKDAPIFLEPEAWPKFGSSGDALELRSVRVAPDFEAHTEVSPALSRT